ncbi:hypothetical protein ACLOJK_019671 [Asimina triloba]
MARFRSEMGHDRSGIELNLLMTGEEDSPRVASMINVGLRSQQIWNVLVVAVVMNSSDGPMECLTAVGFRRWQARLTVTRGGRRWVRRRGRADGSFDGGIGRWLSASGGGCRRRATASPAAAPCGDGGGGWSTAGGARAVAKTNEVG